MKTLLQTFRSAARAIWSALTRRLIADHALMDEIPPGAVLTVTLENGTTFTGTETTRDEFRAVGVLRIEREINDVEYEVFYTHCSQLASFSMICER